MRKRRCSLDFSTLSVLPLVGRDERYPELRDNPSTLEHVINVPHSTIGRWILMAWNFHPDLAAVATEHENLKRESAMIDYVDVVSIANLRNRTRSQHGFGGVDIKRLPAHCKLGLGKGHLPAF